MTIRLISIVIIGVALFITPSRLAVNLDVPLTWDEADIYYVAEKGFFANYINNPSAPLIDFVRLGLAKKNNDQASVKEISQQLPAEQEDLFIRRHFHPPLSVYLWSLFYAENAPPQKQAYILRYSTIVLWVIFVFSLLLCSWWVSGKSPLNPVVALLLLATLGSGFFAMNLMYMNYHLLFGICSIWYVASLIQLTKAPSLRNLVLFGLTAALLIAALETHIVIILLSLAYAGFTKPSAFINTSFLLRFMAVLIIAVLLVWPGFYLKGELIKSWMMYAYRIFFVNNEEYASVDSASLWFRLFTNFPLLFLCMLGGTIATIRYYKKLVMLYFLPLVCGLGYSIFISPFIIFQYYLLPAICMILFGLVLMASVWAESIRLNTYKMGLIIILAIFISLILHFSYNSKTLNIQIAQSSERWNELIGFLQEVPKEKPVFMDGGHLFQIYLQDYDIRQLEAYNHSAPGFYERIGHDYVNRRNNIVQEEYGAVVIKKSRLYADTTLQTLINNNYRKYDFPEYMVFINE